MMPKFKTGDIIKSRFKWNKYLVQEGGSSKYYYLTQINALAGHALTNIEEISDIDKDYELCTSMDQLHKEGVL